VKIIHIARKDWICARCKEPIPKGTRFRRLHGKHVHLMCSNQVRDEVEQ